MGFIIFKVGFLKITEKKIERWTKNQKFEKLAFALANNSYKIRMKAAQGLGELRDKNAIPFLEITIDDNIQI